MSNLGRGVEMVKFFLLVQGQVNGHNVLVQRKFYLSRPIVQISLYLSVHKQFTLSKTV